MMEPPTPDTPALNALIVDDERPAREELRWLLEQCAGVHVLDTAQGADEARELLAAARAQGNPIDLVFLDINMSGVGGMRLAELLYQSAPPRTQSDAPAPGVIFVTAYQDYAVDAFAVDAIDYLLKPVRLERLQKAVARARRKLLPSPDTQPNLQAAGNEPPGAAPEAAPLERISVEDQGVYRVIPVDEILYFEADGGVVVAATRAERFITDFSLKFLEENLSDALFFRSHRSYIVRLDAIESIAPWGAGTYRLIFDRARDLGAPLSRSRAGELKSLIPWSARVVDS